MSWLGHTLGKVSKAAKKVAGKKVSHIVSMKNLATVFPAMAIYNKQARAQVIKTYGPIVGVAGGAYAAGVVGTGGSINGGGEQKNNLFSQIIDRISGAGSGEPVIGQGFVPDQPGQQFSNPYAYSSESPDADNPGIPLWAWGLIAAAGLGAVVVIMKAKR